MGGEDRFSRRGSHFPFAAKKIITAEAGVKVDFAGGGIKALLQVNKTITSKFGVIRDNHD